MKNIKKLALVIPALLITFAFSAAADAQGRRNPSRHDNGLHRGWDKHNRNNQDDRNRNNNGISYRERQRLMRERARLNNARSRSNRDGNVSEREMNRLNRRTIRYRRNVRRARNN